MQIFNDQATKAALANICGFCLDKNYKISVAESVTSGMIQLMLSTCPNAGLFFAGGITAYSCMQKLRQLGISVEKCLAMNGVSAKLSENMAKQICEKFNTELGLGITGFATPIPEKGIKELYAYVSFYFKQEHIFTERLIANGNGQLEIQQNFAASLLQLCSETLKSLK